MKWGVLLKCAGLGLYGIGVTLSRSMRASSACPIFLLGEMWLSLSFDLKAVPGAKP